MNKRFVHGHAVVVGVGADLPGTVDDAVALAGILQDPARCAYPPEQIHTLAGERATRDAFLCALDGLARSTDPRSAVIVFFSGHGCRAASSIGEACYLVTHGCDLARLCQTAVSGAEFAERLRAIPAHKLLVLLDCCHAGAFGEAKAPGLQLSRSALPPEARQLLAEGAGRVLIASSREDERSFAGRPYSAFTLALIETFSGVGVARQDGYVRVADLALHAREVVPGRTRGRQHPILHFEHADNFSLAFYAGGDTQPKGLPFAAEPEIEPEPGAWRMGVDLRGQTVHGPQTVVAGDVQGPVLSGEFDGAVALAGGEAVDLRGAQTVVYKPIFQQAPEPEIPPPPKPDSLPTVKGFIGREEQLAYFADKLATGHLAVICGPPGVGKTDLASVLAYRVREGNLSSAFWYPFDPDKDLESAIRELAGFLYWQGQTELWHWLERQRLEESLDHAFQMLRGHGYLLCFDNLHCVEDEDLLDEFDRAIDSAVQAGELDVIVTSECTPSLVKDMDQFDPLLGLSQDETRVLFAKVLPAEAEIEQLEPHSTQTLLDMQALTNAELLVNLHARTEGNPLLLRCALDALDPDRSPNPNRAHFLMHLYEDKDIWRFLMEEIEENLEPEERAVMQAVAVLQGQAGTRGAIEAILDGENVWCTLRDLADRHLLREGEGEAGREYSMNAIIRHFYYDSLSEREAMHYRAGEYYETEEPDILKAARHFAEAKEYERAARLVTRDVRALVNKGQDRPLRRLLDKLVKEELAPEQKARVYRARGEFYDLEGERDLARESYEQTLSTLNTLPDSDTMRELKTRVRQAMSDLEHHEPRPATSPGSGSLHSGRLML
jgi:hypothetical protein